MCACVHLFVCVWRAFLSVFVCLGVFVCVSACFSACARAYVLVYPFSYLSISLSRACVCVLYARMHVSVVLGMCVYVYARTFRYVCV